MYEHPMMSQTETNKENTDKLGAIFRDDQSKISENESLFGEPAEEDLLRPDNIFDSDTDLKDDVLKSLLNPGKSKGKQIEVISLLDAPNFKQEEQVPCYYAKDRQALQQRDHNLAN